MDALREAGDGAIGLAAPHRGAVRTGRGDHQNRGLARGLHQALIGPGRCVALHEHALGIAPARAIEQFGDRVGAQHPLGERPCTGDQGPASAGLGIELEKDIEPLGRQMFDRPFRPFDEHDRARLHLVETELVEFAASADPVQVRMDQGYVPGLVGLEQREGGARGFEFRIAEPGAQDGAGKGRLAGPDLAGESDEIASLQLGGQRAAELLGCGLVGQGHGDRHPAADDLGRARGGLLGQGHGGVLQARADLRNPGLRARHGRGLDGAHAAYKPYAAICCAGPPSPGK